MRSRDNPDPVDLLEKLVAFPTVSNRSNLDLIEFARAYLAGCGVESFLCHNDDGTKANLYAQVGPDTEGGVVLSGHTDVVPVDGQTWSSDPFRLTERDGRCYGRGTADMKGFLAAVLAHVPAMSRAGLRRPVQIALSYDEEVGCLGAPSMIAEMVRRFPKASAVIVGEPSMMKIVNGHKACVGFETHVRGHSVHSCRMHAGVSATMTAARLVNWLHEKTEENRAAGEAECGYDPPYTTLHVGTMAGGTAGNITAKDCRFTTDIRCMPSESPEGWMSRYEARAAVLEEEIRATSPDAGIRVSGINIVPGLRPEPDGAAESLVRGLTGRNRAGVVSYGTEAGQFQGAGYSAVICGPGSIVQAHQPDEYITRAQLQECTGFLQRLTSNLSA